MPEITVNSESNPRVGREIALLLMVLVACAELAAAVYGLVYPPKWLAAAMLVAIGLVTIVFALVRCGVVALAFGGGPTTGDSAPQLVQSIAVSLVMAVGIGVYTFAASFIGFATGFYAMSDHPPPSAAAAFFSFEIQFWLIFNPFSLLCGIATVLLFARMLHLSRSGLAPTSVKAVV